MNKLFDIVLAVLLFTGIVPLLAMCYWVLRMKKLEVDGSTEWFMNAAMGLGGVIWITAALMVFMLLA